jgi:uncharacterized protein (TIGR02391 family)
MRSIREQIAEPQHLFDMAVEDVAAALIEIVPPNHEDGVSAEAIITHWFPSGGSSSFPYGHRKPALMAIIEAIEWLRAEGLVVRNPEYSFQGREHFVLSRRGQTVRSRGDMKAFTKTRALPRGLLQPVVIDKVYPIFARGDYDIAVNQAFKEVEVAVRKACGYPNDMVGKSLVTRAFQPEDGPLTDIESVRSEREAVMALFVGAIGHAKNPTSHRDVDHDRVDAAKLIMFASYLLEHVTRRAIAASHAGPSAIS